MSTRPSSVCGRIFIKLFMTGTFNFAAFPTDIQTVMVHRYWYTHISEAGRLAKCARKLKPVTNYSIWSTDNIEWKFGQSCLLSYEHIGWGVQGVWEDSRANEMNWNSREYGGGYGLSRGSEKKRETWSKKCFVEICTSISPRYICKYDLDYINDWSLTAVQGVRKELDTF